MSALANFVIDTAICGYHVYKDIWPNSIDEEQLTCVLVTPNSDALSCPHNISARLLGASKVLGFYLYRQISPL